MKRLQALRTVLVLLAASILGSNLALGQGVLVTVNSDDIVILPRPPIIIVPPHPRPIPRPLPTSAGSYKIKQLEVNARLDGQLAKVQVSQSFVNTGSRPMEVSFVFPLPYEGAVDQLTLLVDGKEFPAKLLDANEARKMYEDIVRRNQDPALLEWVGTGLFKTNVFPVPPGQQRTVTLRYSQVCRQWDGLTDFIFPLSTAKYTSQPIEEIKFNVAVESESEIKNIYSPSHSIEIKRPDEKHAVLSFTAKNAVPLDDFRLFYDVGKGIVGTRVVSYRPQTSEDGYFLLLASPQIKAADAQRPKKTVVLAVDRSGSMSGPKIDQAKNAAKFVINNLREGDLFNLIAYDSEVESWRPELQKFNEETRTAALGFVEGIYAGGSTNINGALGKVLTQLNDSSRPNFVIFLTDGIPTVGETNEMKIVANAKSNNRVHARIFDFGVGYDVNSRLLDKLARENFGLTEYVRPNEDIERAVAALYNRIGSPVMTDVKLSIDLEGLKPEDGAAANRVYPKDVVDLFTGEQLVIVGRYKKPGAAKVVVSGKVGGQEQKLDFPANLVEHSGDDSQAFIEKLWAVRRVGEVLDEIDLHGKNDELVKELVALSLKHGIMTPYTSFMADENAKRGELTLLHNEASLRLGALNRSTDGAEGVEQRIAKHDYQRADRPTDAASQFGFGGGGRYAQGASGPAGGFGGGQNSNMSGRAITTAGGTATPAASAYGGVAEAKDDVVKVIENVRQVGRKAFYRQGNRWIDSVVTAEKETQQKPSVKVKRFSTAYFDLIDKYGREAAKYLATDDPVTIELGGQVYEVE